ncbi:hypothetical protein MML48_6g00020872 [Holotrichia oblita]|uniref:Uncharacterized protein n=1 Tax=Holotrichia oblita TaxID=644536 RepID=A0ACB9SWR6_HOLOL|nr:hypothetical protein MML48_6g00020872 [Holotrichia oblita]
MLEMEVKNLKELITSSIGEDFQIIAQSQKLLTAPGDHYGSIMQALDVTIKLSSQDKEELLRLVAKLIPASDLLRAMFDIQVTFKKEVSAYLDAIPALIDFQREYNVPENRILDIFPKCYGARINLNNNNGDVDEDAAIILENLKCQGYETGDRFVGFDYAHAELIVKDLAKFHAIPIAMQKLKPEEFKRKVLPCSVKNDCFDNVPEEVASAFHNSIMNGAKQVPELEPFLDRIEKLVEIGLEDMVKGSEPNNLFATVVHSDYWLSNTMVLKDDTEKPIKNKIVDLQIMQYSSCVRDLIFFLFTSVINEDLDENYDKLVDLYCDTFVEYLSDFKLDTKEYSRESFRKEIEVIGPKEFYHVGFMLKPILTEKGKVASFENFHTRDWCREDLLGEAHKRKLKQLIFSYQKRNWI